MLTDKYSERRYDVSDESIVDTDILEHIPFDYPGTSTKVTYSTGEFTSVCPWTGLPDFAELNIIYYPRYRLVELKSLKYYLTSFRNVGILQEHAINRVLTDLVSLLQPESMVIEGSYNERGGMRTVVQAEYPPK